MVKAQVKQEKLFKLAAAVEHAKTLEAYLRQSEDAKDVVVVGNFRRCKDTVGDLDILVTAEKSTAISYWSASTPMHTPQLI